MSKRCQMKPPFKKYVLKHITRFIDFINVYILKHAVKTKIFTCINIKEVIKSVIVLISIYIKRNHHR